MSDQTPRQGLSIFDQPAGDPATADRPTAASEAETQVFSPVGATAPQARGSHQPASLPAPTFPVVRRGGYDKAAVDGWLAEHQAQRHDAQQENERLRHEVSELQSQVAEHGSPTYAGLGGHAAAMLRIAEEQANAVTTEAHAAAEESRQRSLHETTSLKADAEKEAADIRMVQMQEVEERRASMLAEAKQERELAKVEAADLLASATREADQLKLAAQQETNTLRTSAKREAEQARAAADRETMEARRMLAVEKERLTKEAAEGHSSATAETARLVDESEARAKSAEERARQAIATATKHREQVTSEGEKSLARSRRESEQIVTSARKQAEQIVANATADAGRQQAAARAEVEMLQKRRDGIVGQLSQLRDLVASFTGVPESAGGTPAQSPDSTDTSDAAQAPGTK